MIDVEQTTHLVASMLLLARIGDVGSTYLATPNLKLEANPLARRFRWPFAMLTILLAAIPYYSLPFGICLLVASLLVCASNFSKIWLVRAMGEEEYHRMVVRMAGRVSVPSTLLLIFAPAICAAAIGFLLLHFYPDPGKDWGFFFAIGFFGYATAVALWGSVAFLRVRKESLAACQAKAT